MRNRCAAGVPSARRAVAGQMIEGQVVSDWVAAASGTPATAMHCRVVLASLPRRAIAVPAAGR